MKKLAIFIVTVAAFSFANAYGCDEKCQKEQAEKEHNVDFPGYLSWSYCDDIRIDFMENSLRSVGKYISEDFDTRYKGGMRNTKQFLEARKAWLQECDQYLQLTGKGRIFDNDKTTKAIYGQIDSVISEFEDLLAGVTYSSENGQDSSTVLYERFELLDKTVDDHKTLMHLKGKYVVR